MGSDNPEQISGAIQNQHRIYCSTLFLSQRPFPEDPKVKVVSKHSWKEYKKISRDGVLKPG